MVPDEWLLPGGFVALGVALVALIVTTILGLISLVRWTRERRWNRACERRMAELYERALAEDLVRTAVIEVERKRYYYRHNVHCPTCGRFSRQAAGWPTGVADCGVHGIGLRTAPTTGSIQVIVAPVAPAVLAPMLEAAQEAPSLIIEPPAPVPDDLSELMEAHPA